MAQPSHLIVGLGNAGSEYAAHRHNVGFMAVAALAERWGAPTAVPSVAWRKGKFRSESLSLAIDGKECLLLKPQTFMNLSGEAVGEATSFFKLAPSQVIVLHDEIDLPAGAVRVKQGGGNAGHNGLKSVDAHIGPDYWRVRIGVGRPERAVGENAVADYVLSDFARADQVWLSPLLIAMARSMPLLLQGDAAGFVKHLPASPQPPTMRE